MQLRPSQKIAGSLLILSVLAVSSLVAVPFVRAQSTSSVSTSIPATPSLNQITLTDYAGSDSAGISDLVAGNIQAYDFGVTPSEASTIPSSGFNDYVSPAAWYGIEVNPTNTTDGFNPFQFQSVRFALNYIVDRNYFVDNLLGGNGIATYSVFGGEPDELITSSATAPYSNITQSITIANSTIYTALTANGATFKSTATPQWYYGGKPITINIYQRTDDPLRDAYAGYLASLLQQIGFATNLVPGDLQDAESAVYGTAPTNATWDIYPTSYGSTYTYYDEDFAILYGTLVANVPASDSYGLAWGEYNVTSAEQPSTIALLNTADKYCIDFFNTNFTSFAQRDADEDALISAGIKAAVVIGLAQSLSPYVASTSLKGVSANFVEDPIMNSLSFLTMNTASGSADIGVRHVAASSLNPVGGYRDSYSIAWGEATQFPPVFYQPSTGYPYTVGWSFDVKADSPTANVAIPTSAIVMNATQDKFVNVASGTMAHTDVVMNLAPMLSQSWQDGQPLTLADILYQYILAGEVTENANSSVYDGYSSSAFGPSWQTVLGFSILNSTSVELYSTFYYPDQYFAGINAAGGLFAFTPTNAAFGMLPWQVYAGMANLVASGKDAWSTSAATAKSLPWLSLVSQTDLANLKTTLTGYASNSTIPPEFASLQSLSGVTLVTPSQAAAGYSAAVSFINKYGNGIIGNGPFILSQYSASTSPAYAILTKNPAFNWGNQMSPQLGAPAVLLSQQANIPGIISPGQSFTVTALQTPDGSTTTTPAPGANVTLQLISSGKIAYQNSSISNSAGQVTFTVPPSLPVGAYILSLWTGSAASTLYNPLVQSVELSPGAISSSATSTTTAATTSSTVPPSSTTVGVSTTTSTATSTSTTTGASTTLTTTTSTSTSIALSPAVLGSVVVVAVVLIAALALGTSRRRGYPHHTEHTLYT